MCLNNIMYKLRRNIPEGENLTIYDEQNVIKERTNKFHNKTVVIIGYRRLSPVAWCSRSHTPSLAWNWTLVAWNSRSSCCRIHHHSYDNGAGGC